MLKRTTQFLQQPAASATTPSHDKKPVFPALFVVLPLPCVNNSRYLTREHFLEIMNSLGYSVLNSKESKRMAYWLFNWTSPVPENSSQEGKEWKKRIIKDGGGRNNFAIAT
jgi:25S rRNA (adenine2142-N1)-methyltransferase